MPKSNHTSSKNDHTVHLIPGLSNPNARSVDLSLENFCMNFSRSCYLNSSLQLLASSSVLHATLPLPGADSGTASPSSPSLQSLLSGDSYTDLPLTSALTAILNKLWNGTSKGPQSAAGLQRLLAAKNGDLDGSSQQDAHEALLNLLDQIRLEEVDVGSMVLRPSKKLTLCLPKDDQKDSTA
jgi:ubiquitin C-terminal hydrolase